MVTADLISVIIPCRNAAPWIEEAVSSALAQTYLDLEVIAVDDGSTDSSLAILQRLAASDSRLRVISQPNRGPAAARNSALRAALGAFACFLDADDALLPDKLRIQHQAFRRLPAVDLVYSGYFLGDARLQPTGYVPACLPAGSPLDAFARRNWFAPMCPLLRRSLVDRTGLFDESICGAEDWDYWIRCALTGRFLYLPGAVAIYRTHPQQLHSDPTRMWNAARQVVAKHFPPGSPLHHTAAACLHWSGAKESYRAGRYLRALSILAASEYHSRRAGGLSLSAREANTIVLPPPAAEASLFAH